MGDDRPSQARLEYVSYVLVRVAGQGPPSKAPLYTWVRAHPGKPARANSWVWVRVRVRVRVGARVRVRVRVGLRLRGSSPLEQQLG